MAGQIEPFVVDAWNAVTVPMDTATAALIGSLETWSSGWFIKVVPAYLVILLFIAMWSQEELAVLRFWKSVMAAVLVYMFISTLSIYNYYVAGIVDGTMASLTNAVIGVFGSTQTAPQAFNSLSVKYSEIGNAVYQAIPDYSFKAVGLTFIVALYDVLVQLVLWLVFVLYLCSYILTKYVVAYGPIFIAMYFFEATYPFFDGWFRAVAAGMLTQAFLVGDLSLMVNVLTGLLHTVGAQINPTAAFAANGDVGFLIWDLMGSLGLLVLFGAIGLLSVRLAMAISGGAHAQLVRLPRPGSGRIPASASPPSGGSDGGGGSVGSGPSAGPGGSASPPRAHAFETATPMSGAAP
jgi:hypothetical protein